MLRFTENRRSSGLSTTTNPRTSLSTHGLIEATKTQAEGGTVTGRYMSPLRSKQLVDFLVGSELQAYNQYLTTLLGAASEGQLFTFDSSGHSAGAYKSIYDNLIINGGMDIDQRREGSSVTPTVHTTGIADRWGASLSVASKYSVQRVSAPTGFDAYGLRYALKATVVSAYTAGAAEEFGIYQQIMGRRVSHLLFGNANARPVAIAFVAQSSVTGTYAGRIKNEASDQCYVFTYTISAANTPTEVKVYIAGDTSGTWQTDERIGIQLYLDLGGGSNFETTAGSWVSSDKHRTAASIRWLTNAAATFYVSGVRLVQGAIAPAWQSLVRPFEHEERLCKFYYRKTFNRGTAPAQAVGTATGEFALMSQAAASFGAPIMILDGMRTSITLTTYNPVSANANWRDVTNSADRTFSGAALGHSSIALYGTGGAASADTRIHFTLDSDYYA